MAFLPQDEQNQNAPQGQTTNNPQNVPPQGTGGSVGAGAAGPKAGTAPNAGTSTQFGSSASKLGDYLSANAPQITNQANNIAGQLGNQYQTVNQDITNAANQFNQQVQGGYTAQNKDLVNQAVGDTTNFAKDQNNVANFQKQLNDQYTGPQNYQNTDQYGNIQNEVNQAVQNSALLKTAPGLQQYFAQNQKNPTQASATLDQLLVQGNPDAKATVETAANQFNTLPGQFQDTTTNANQSVQAAQQAAQDAAKYAQSQLGNETQGFNTNISNQTAAAQKAAADQIALYNQELSNTPTFNDAFRSLGVNDDQALALNQAYNTAATPQYLTARNAGADTATKAFNLRDYLNTITPETDISAANTATADQYGLAQALQQLYGQTNAPALALDPTQAALAGTAPKDVASFNYDQALKDISGYNDYARQVAQGQADAQAAAQDAAHAASKQHGFGGFINRSIPSAIKGAINPALLIPNQINAVKRTI